MRVGSLFSGYGGLDMAVGGEVAWYSEIEPAACKVLAAHHPNVPNLGDIKKIDWSMVEPVDVITGGYPCQPFSNAGMRRGKDDERHLWPYVKDAIGVLRPRFAVLENVRGHLSMGLADVIGDLASLGYDSRWGLIRASDAGAPHSRARVFIFAHTAGQGLQGSDHWYATWTGANKPFSGRSHASDASSQRHGGRQDDRMVGRLGSPSEISRRETSTSWKEPAHRGTKDDIDWGKYEKAVRLWESINRPAPSPTFSGSDGRARLSPLFVEWMMGLPEGHVTGHGLSAAQELKMLGNGVCPQQAQLAIRLLTESGEK